MNKNIQKDKIPADLHTGIYDERKDGMFADEGLLRDGGSSAVMGAQLLAAARDGDTTAVRTLLSMPGAQSFVDYQDEHGATPLHLASYNGHASVTEQLLAARCNVDLQMKDGRNALILAQSQGQSAIVTLLTTFPNLRASMNQSLSPSSMKATISQSVESFKSPSVRVWKDGPVWKEGVRKVDLPTIGVYLVEDVCGFRIASLDSGGQLARIGQVSVGDTLLAINDIWIHDKEVDIIERLSVSVDHNGKLRLLVSRTDSGKELSIVIEKLGASENTQLNSSATFIKTRDSQGEIQRKPGRQREYISLEATSNSSLKAAELTKGLIPEDRPQQRVVYYALLTQAMEQLLSCLKDQSGNLHDRWSLFLYEVSQTQYASALQGYDMSILEQIKDLVFAQIDELRNTKDVIKLSQEGMEKRKQHIISLSAELREAEARIRDLREAEVKQRNEALRFTDTKQYKDVMAMELAKEKQRLQEEYKKADPLHLELAKEKQRLQEEYSKRETDLKRTYDEMIRRAEQGLDEYRKKLEAQFQEKKMRRLEQQNEELRDMNASLEVVDRLEQQNEELRAKNASLERNVAELQDQVNDMEENKAIHESLQRKVEWLQDQMNAMSDVNAAAFEADRERERERAREREQQSAAAAREWKRSQEFTTKVLEQEGAAKRKEEEAAARERQAHDLEAKRREHEADAKRREQEAAKVQEIEIATRSEAKVRLPTATDVLRAHGIPSAHSATYDLFNVEAGAKGAAGAAGAFAGLLHVSVHKIEGFSDTAGFMDRTDPYVALQLGSEKQKTTFKNNAGGKNVTWDERLTFQKKELTDSTLKVRVYDKDSLSDDLQGECDVNLHLLDLRENEEREAPVSFQCVLNGKPAGQVLLSFSRKKADDFFDIPVSGTSEVTKEVKVSPPSPPQEVTKEVKKPPQSVTLPPPQEVTKERLRDAQPQGGWVVTAQNLIHSDVGSCKNWLSEKGDILFHFNPRPNEREIVMNAHINESWGTEERVPLEYDSLSMKNAKWIITVDDRGFRVVDGTSNKLVHVFAHRIQVTMSFLEEVTKEVKKPPQSVTLLPPQEVTKEVKRPVNKTDFVGGPEMWGRFLRDGGVVPGHAELFSLGDRRCNQPFYNEDKICEVLDVDSGELLYRGHGIHGVDHPGNLHADSQH